MSALLQLDELLFSPTAWFAIAADNQAVPGVRLPTLETGLSLVGEGAVATVVGRVRPEVQVVDVDLSGERGHAVVEQLAAWCRRVDVWHLVRPSGGADGRHHLFVLAGDPAGKQVKDLHATVERLRVSMRASARSIDTRRSGHVRPLSAPHRLGGHPKPYGDLRTAVRALRAALSATPAAPLAPSASTPPQAPRPTARRSPVTRTPLAPTRPRRRVDLPPQWATYLRTGAAPPHAGEDQSRSTDELRATTAMLHAGHTAESAWALIAAAHPDAMSKARGNRRRWIAWVWNDVVERDTTTSSTAAGSRAVSADTAPLTGPEPSYLPSPAVAAAVAAARARLLERAWTLPLRRRRSLLLVGHHVLDRMARTDTCRVPVPERDLVLDTGLRDRKTIRAALRLLDGPPAGRPADVPAGACSGVGVLHTDTWDPAKKDSSSYEFEIHPAPDEGVREIPPPCIHTPLPRGLWTQLPGHAHALWRALVASPEALTVDQVLHASALTDTPTSAPSPAQARTGHQVLTELARAGLAHCTADATWVVRHAPGLEHTQRAARCHDELSAEVAAERAAYRSATSSWNLERARAHKAQFTRERAWWNALDPTERDRRRDAWRSEFDALAVLDQERLKTHLAQRRIRVGVDEPARHRAWLDALPRPDYATRVSERQRRYDQLPRPLQQASVAAWERHRARFGLDRHLVDDSQEFALLPDTAEERDRAHLETQTLRLAGVRVAG